jgi:hypothetical protein
MCSLPLFFECMAAKVDMNSSLQGQKAPQDRPSNLRRAQGYVNRIFVCYGRASAMSIRMRCQRGLSTRAPADAALAGRIGAMQPPPYRPVRVYALRQQAELMLKHLCSC